MTIHQRKRRKAKNSILDLFNKAPVSKGHAAHCSANDGNQVTSPRAKLKENKTQRKDMSAWFQLFSELDPLANPDAIAKKIDGGNGSGCGSSVNFCSSGQLGGGSGVGGGTGAGGGMGGRDGRSNYGPNRRLTPNTWTVNCVTPRRLVRQLEPSVDVKIFV